MGETARLGLPLVAGGQAQKHVTVNEALARIDALTGLVLESTGILVPPIAPEEAACFAVPAGASGAWSGQAGQIAIYLGGGWDFVIPPAGLRAFVSDEGLEMRCDGNHWHPIPLAVSEQRASWSARVLEFDHSVGAGPVSDTTTLVPAETVVMAVTGRVLSGVTGTATSFSLGVVGGAADTFGSGIATAAGTGFRAMALTPVGFRSATALRISGDGGDLAAGSIRLSVHLAEFTAPEL